MCEQIEYMIIIYSLKNITINTVMYICLFVRRTVSCGVEGMSAHSTYLVTNLLRGRSKEVLLLHLCFTVK